MDKMTITFFLNNYTALQSSSIHETIAQLINENTPPMYEFTGKWESRTCVRRAGFDISFEVQRIMDGNQYLLWRRNYAN